MGTLVACDDVETAPPTTRVTAVNVVPAQLQLTVGGTATLTATVVGDAGLQDRSVEWTSSNPAIATVDAAGNVTGKAAGQTTIIASSHADPNVKGAAAVVVNAAAVPAVAISSITKNGQPIDINNVQGQVDVTLNLSPNGAPINSVDLLVQCPNNASPVLVQSQTFSGAAAPTGPITLSFNSAAINAAGTGPTFTNGACNIIARLVTPAGSPVAQDVVRPATFQNVDYVSAVVSSTAGPAPDQNGTPWRGGDVTVRVLPVFYSGQTADKVTIALTGTTTSGAAFSRTQTVSGPFPKDVVFPNVGTGTNAAGIAGVTVPNVQVVASALNASGISITPTGTQAPTFNLDTQAPAAGAYAFNTQGTANQYVGTAFLFNTATGNGYTAAVTPQGANDFGGVDRVTVTYEAAPIDTRTQSCTSAQTGLTFTAVTSTSNLNSTLTNGSTPFGPSYCLRMVETDALGNKTTTYVGVFGVDKENPVLFTSKTTGTKDKSSFDIDGIDQIPTDAFPVAGTAAQAAAASITLRIRDTLSGFDATPINYSITRLTTAGTACVVGTGTSCAKTDGAQTYATVGLTEAQSTILITGGSTVNGYYTFSGIVRDRAANNGDSTVTRQVLVDNVAPTVGGVSIAQLYTGNTTATFNTSAADNLDLYLATSSIQYLTVPGFGAVTIRSTQQQIGTPFDATLTTSVNPLVATFPNFYRSLTHLADQAGDKPDAVFIRAWDAATNVSTPNATGQGEGQALIPGANVQSSTFLFTSTQLQGFGIVAPTANCEEGSTCTISVAIFGNTDVFTNPLAGVNIYARDAVTGELIPVTSAPLTTASQTDNGAVRTYTYSFAGSLPVGTTTLYAIGFTASGDAIISDPFNVTTDAAP